MAYWHKPDGSVGHWRDPESKFDGSHLMPLVVFLLVCLWMWLNKP